MSSDSSQNKPAAPESEAAGAVSHEKRGPFDPWVLSAPNQPVIIAHQRVLLPCGCSVFIGTRMDKGENACVATECTPEHRTTMKRFYELMEKSLENPQPRPMIDVVEELIEKANSEREAGVL